MPHFEHGTTERSYTLSKSVIIQFDPLKLFEMQRPHRAYVDTCLMVTTGAAVALYHPAVIAELRDFIRADRKTAFAADASGLVHNDPALFVPA